MNSRIFPASPTRADFCAVAARWILGAFFVYMGLAKALHPEAFLKLVRQYELVSSPVLLNAIAAGLPWFEVFCGLLLLAGVAVRGASLMLVLMLIPFTTVVIKRALGIAAAQGMPFWTVKFDCGCGTGEVLIWKKVLENSFFVLLSCWLLSGRGQILAARFSLFGSDPLKAETQNPSLNRDETTLEPEKQLSSFRRKESSSSSSS
jgi:uncharacterized membrane protein YphA (DoxX/SURF4 family)